jgi:hypothetical protein
VERYWRTPCLPGKHYRYEGFEHDADELIMDVESRFRVVALLSSIGAPKRFVFHANGSAASDLERFSVRADIETIQIGGLNVSPDLVVLGVTSASDLEGFSVRADIETFQIGGLKVSPDSAALGGHLCLRLGTFLGPCGH